MKMMGEEAGDQDLSGDIKNFNAALKFGTQLRKFFFNVRDNHGWDLINKLNVNKLCQLKSRQQETLTD